MKKLNNLKWFTLGITLTVLVAAFIIPVLASVRKVQVMLNYNDIKITFDGTAIVPRDENGTIVEPFIIDGTAYLPVRGIADALGLDVSWDGNTSTVILTTTEQSNNQHDIIKALFEQDFPEKEKINKILADFYNEHLLPGGISMAISYKGKLVYANSVGYADKDHKVPLTPEYRMRIASVSKPITSIAIMKLIEENKIHLDDIVFGETGILGTEYGMPVYKNNFAEITVKNLLEHTSGGWGNSKNDPMFMITDKDGKALIQEVLKKYPLSKLPGTERDYSNFGYYILGRVIEEISGETYENYVKTNILTPCGISGMRIGGDTSSHDEVEYFPSLDGRNPYHLKPFHMDAHGGWIANPIELLKILVRVDALSDSEQLLKPETIKTMTAPSIRNENYALGWCVNKSNNWWHMGGMPGTSAMMARSSRGFNWAILVNSIVPISDIDKLFWEMYLAVQNWPEGIEL